MLKLKLLFFGFMILLFFNSCCKYKSTACLSINKNPAMLGDTIVIKNCSYNEDGISPSFKELDFGDGNKVIGSDVSYKLDSITHIYKKAGTYMLSISVGGAECGDTFETKISIIE